jgi:uncharacterized protein (TIGR02145 family)
MSESEKDNNQGSGWGAFGAFGKRADVHGDSTRSFSVFTIFFILLALCGIGYYTYYQAQGATFLNKTIGTSTNLEPGLVLHYTLDGTDTTSTTVTDISGSGNNGVIATPASRIVPIVGKIGQGLKFDGTTSGQVITVAADASHENLSAYTLSAWVKPGLSGNDILIAKGFGSSNADNGFLWRLLSTGAMSFTYSYSVTDIFRASAAGVVDSEEWNLVTIIWDGSTTATNIRMYVNGAEVTYGSATNGSGSRVSDTGQSIRIGNSAGGSAVLDAAIDDIRIYSRVLSVAEIQALYSQGVGTKINMTETPSNFSTGLVGHWTFDGPDMTTATATDVSGNGNDGSIIGIKATQGKMGQAINGSVFSNTISTYTNINSLPQMTISFWGKSITSGTLDRVRWVITPRTNSFRFSRVTSGIPGVWDVAFADKGSSWVHYVVTYDSSSLSNDPKVYIDGVAQSVTETFTPSGTISSEANQLYNLPNLLNGTLDDVRIYNRILSADEVAQLYQLGGGSKIKICREEAVQDADGNWYNTIAIGSQCWLDRNMNVGTRISASTNQTNNDTIEKYCYSNSDANCTTNNPNKPDGGLYQWNEAMQYSTEEGAQGICPSGFHIPTDAEWYTLEKFLADSGQACSGTATGYRCAPAGTKLEPGGSSLFEGNRAGLALFGLFNVRGVYGNWWSSSPSGGNAWYRNVASGEAGVFRNADAPGLGFSVRCLQD